jgi:tRNA A-37 threonylcarbamoyl transferase component Bud32
MANALLETTTRALGIGNRDIVVLPFSKLHRGVHIQRHEFYRTFLLNGKTAFVKRALCSQFNEDLIREARATKLARDIGISVVDVYSVGTEESLSYKEHDNLGIIALEFLEPDDWKFINNTRQLAGLKDPEIKQLAQNAAEFIHNYSGYKLTKSTNTDFLQLTQSLDRQNRLYPLIEDMQQVWIESQVVFDKISNIFPGEKNAAHNLRNLVDDVQLHIEDLAKKIGDQNEEYFLHGDLKPYHIILNQHTNDPRTHIVIDFGAAYKTSHQALAKLQDIMLFVGHSWPNEKLQKTFFQEVFTQEKNGLGSENTYHLLRSAIVMATFCLSKDGMEPNHRDHRRASTLLLSLEKNLQVIEEISHSA